MKVQYKHPEPEIVLKPQVYAMLKYIAENIKTNLMWVCLIRKLGKKYIVEDIYIPPQNVNEWVMCNFDEDYVSRVSYSTFNNDYRPCRFNMIGRFMMSKSADIDNDAITKFEKVMNPMLDEFVMMQLNNKGEMSFAVNRKATILSDLSYTIDLEDLIDKGAFKALLDSKIGKYTFTTTTASTNVVELKQKSVGAEKVDVNKKSILLSENISWKAIL